MKYCRHIPVLLISALMLPLSSLISNAQSAQQVQALLSSQSPLIVTVKVIYKTSMIAGGNSTNREGKSDTTGVVITSDGLVMLSTTSYSTDSLASIFSGGDMPGFSMKTVPTDFKVTIGKESKEYTAILAATDSILGLTFIQISDLDGRKLASLDMSKSQQPSVGERVVAVNRLTKGFDYAPYFSSAQISGQIDLPRTAYMLDGSIGSLGLPVYNLQGDLLGILTTLKPTVSQDTDEGGFSSLIRLFSGGGGGIIQTFLVPTSTVQTVIAQAEVRAKAELAKQALKPAVTQKSGTAKK